MVTPDGVLDALVDNRVEQMDGTCVLTLLRLPGFEPTEIRAELVEETLVAGWVGTVSIDQGIVTGVPIEAEMLKLTVIGSQQAPKLEARESPNPWVFDLADVGISDRATAERAAARLPFLLVAGRPGDPRSGWVHRGGLYSFLVGAKATAARSRATRDDVFVNPYTFVPFPTSITRSVPPGHHRLAPGRLAGTVSVTWRAVSPLLLRGPKPLPDEPIRPHRRTDGRVFVPGSGVKGAVRSLHETLAGGCLRIFDDDFVPIYRQQAKPRSAGWKLCVVRHVDGNGAPTGLEACSDVVHAKVAYLHQVTPPQELHSGDLFALDASRFYSDAGRVKVDEDGVVGLAGASDPEQWVAHVTSAQARRRDEPYYVTMGKLPGRAVTVAKTAWLDFFDLVDGSDDVRVRRAGRKPDLFVSHDLDGPIGWRSEARGRLDPGEVVWAKVDSGEATALSLAQVWRERGGGTSGQRVPAALQACTAADDLCASCQLFGSADQDGRAVGEASQQDGYRGHVRIGDAVSSSPVQGTVTHLAPAGSPRPGSGQFYLVQPAGRLKAQRGEPPSSRWGAEPDRRAGEPRMLRGRKYYWHGDPTDGDDPNDRHRVRAHQSSTMTVAAELLPAGVELMCRITFDNLGVGDLGGLLGALDPNLVLPVHPGIGFAGGDVDGDDSPKLASHLGGGKAWGLGSVAAVSLAMDLHDADSRYRCGAQPSVTVADAVEAFKRQVPDTTQRTWPQLAAALSYAWVNPARIWYPPGANWSARRYKPQQFDEGYKFWQNSAGSDVNGAPPLLALPDAADPDQYLDISPT